MHSLLRRQLRRHLGSCRLEELDERVAALLGDVSEAYRQADADRQLVERSLELTSQELMDRHERLREDLRLREQAELRLRESEERLRLVSLAANDALWERRFDSDRIWWNDGFRALFHYEPSAVEATNAWWAAHVHPEDRARVQEGLEEALRTGKRCWSDEYRFQRADGSYAFALDRGYVTRDESGVPLRMVGAMIDMTSHRKLEDQLRQAQKMEAIGRLAGGVAHDFNNMLCAITGYADLLAEDLEFVPRPRAKVEEIRRAASRATKLTRQLLAFSRKQILKPSCVDLNTSVEGVLRMLRHVIGENIEIVTRLEEHLGSVRADASQLEQVVMNLAVNAKDAMPLGGCLTIETANIDYQGGRIERRFGHEPSGYVMLLVKDTGKGMDEETRLHLFEPFYTTKQAGQGTGLGLSSVYGIVTQSEGQILVDSEPERGTTFRVLLPRMSEKPLADPVKEGTEPAHGGEETILLVEDEDIVRSMLRGVLERAGYRVLAAANGHEALLRIERHVGSIQLMVSDVVMPQMGGRELARRAQRLRPAMRVLFVSGYTDDAFDPSGELEPGVELLAKPFPAEALVRRVRRLLDEPRGTRPPRAALAATSTRG